MWKGRISMNETNGITEIRTLNPEELDDSLRLSEYAFQFELSDAERENERKSMAADWIWGAFVDGKLAAQVIQYPLEVYIQGRKMGMGGIGGVSCWPEARRGGLVAGLLVRSIRDMKEKGQIVSLLTPFSYAFYRRYGWEMAIDRKKYTVPAYLFPVSAKAHVPGSIERLPQEEDAIIERLGPVYEQYAARYNGTLSRTPDWWKQRVIRKRKGDYAVYRDEAGRIQGYLQYRMKNREFTVHECVALTPEAERGLWRFIAMHDSMAERAVLYVPVDDGLSILGAEPRFGQAIEPYFMARIVDLIPFLEQYAFTPLEDRPAGRAGGEPAVFTLEVSDEHADWNNGRFTVAVDAAGRAEVTRDRSARDGDAVISGTIQAFAALFTGYRTAEQLRRYGRLAADDGAIGLLDALVSPRTPFLCDFF